MEECCCCWGVGVGGVDEVDFWCCCDAAEDRIVVSNNEVFDPGRVGELVYECTPQSVC